MKFIFSKKQALKRYEFLIYKIIRKEFKTKQYCCFYNVDRCFGIFHVNLSPFIKEAFHLLRKHRKRF